MNSLCGSILWCTWHGVLTTSSWRPQVGHGKTVRIWDTATGECTRKIVEGVNNNNSHQEVFCVSWLPDSKRFVTGGIDSMLCMWNLEGKKLHMWSECTRIQDLVVSKDGSKLVCLGAHRNIHIYDLNSTNIGTIEYGTGVRVSSLALSNDGLKLLVATQNRQIHLWELEDDLTQPQPTGPSAMYKAPGGEEGQRYIIRMCFGGNNEAFVLSGSEECTVYVWHRRSGELLAELEGHSGTVNAVHWNPADPYMLASASDDKSVHIWGVSDAVISREPARS